jgi:hypothetical protein
MGQKMDRQYMTAQNSPKESSNGEVDVKQRIRGNNASQVAWKTPACPVQKKKNEPGPSSSVTEE